MPASRINTMLFPGGKQKAFTCSYDDGVVRSLPKKHCLLLYLDSNELPIN